MREGLDSTLGKPSPAPAAMSLRRALLDLPAAAAYPQDGRDEEPCGKKKNQRCRSHHEPGFRPVVASSVGDRTDQSTDNNEQGEDAACKPTEGLLAGQTVSCLHPRSRQTL
jgi:hypothetical protein